MPCARRHRQPLRSPRRHRQPLRPTPPVPWPPPLSVVHGRLVSSPPSCASCQVTAWVSAWAGSAGAACEPRARGVRAAFSSPFGEHSRGNQDAIMIRVLSHRWHSAGEESDRYSVRSSRAARETACAAQAQEREQRCVSTPSRHSRGGERHAREGGQPPLSRASSTRRAPACTARVCKQEQQRVSMPSQRSRGDERHAREGNQLRKSRAASGILRPRTRAGGAA